MQGTKKRGHDFFVLCGFGKNMLVKIKPLSVNDAWQGKRYKTNEYKAFEQELLLKLRRMDIPENEILLKIIWGFSSAASDIDNPLKPFIDVLQKKYIFNDKAIKKLEVESCNVPKGEEFIYFEIDIYKQSGKLNKLLSYLGL